MSKKEHVMEVLQGMGYSPKYDDEGDIMLVFQMKHIFFMLNEEDEDNFLTIQLPQFVDLEEEDVSMALAICNKMTRELKGAKVYVDNTFKSASANFEIFYANDESLEYSIRKSLRTLAVIRSQYHKNRAELT